MDMSRPSMRVIFSSVKCCVLQVFFHGNYYLILGIPLPPPTESPLPRHILVPYVAQVTIDDLWVTFQNDFSVPLCMCNFAV